MKCVYCGGETPDDSRFCECCGKNLTDAAPDAPQPAVEPIAPPQAEAPDVRGKVKKRRSGRRIALIAVAAVLILGLAGLNVYQYLAHSAAAKADKATISSLRQENEDMSGEVESLTEELEDLYAAANAVSGELEGLSIKADDLAAIREFLSGDGAGYGSEEFHASTPVLVLEPYETASFEVLSFYDDDITVTMSAEGYSADAQFSEEEWLTAATTVYVTAYSPGLTVLSFRTDTHSETFKVLVVVAEGLA